jgi:hypothetical protein
MEKRHAPPPLHSRGAQYEGINGILRQLGRDLDSFGVAKHEEHPAT